MAFQTLIYKIKADGTQFKAETNQMAAGTRRIGEEMDANVASIGKMSAAAGGMLAIVSQLSEKWREVNDRMHAADTASIQTGIGAELLGDRAAALAVEGIGMEYGIGPEQYFDASEAVRDALLNKSGDSGRSARNAANRIGLDRKAFTDPDVSSFDRSNMLLDALIAFEGPEGDLLQAASELGSGDLRDFISMAGIVKQAPGYHPGAVAQSIRDDEAALTPEQAQANAEAALARNLADVVGRELQSAQGTTGYENLVGLLPFADPEEITRRLGSDALSGVETPVNPFGVGVRPPSDRLDDLRGLVSGVWDWIRADPEPEAHRQRVIIELRDSTTGGIRAVQEITDGQEDGRAISHGRPGVPAR